MDKSWKFGFSDTPLMKVIFFGLISGFLNGNQAFALGPLRLEARFISGNCINNIEREQILDDNPNIQMFSKMNQKNPDMPQIIAVSAADPSEKGFLPTENYVFVNDITPVGRLADNCKVYSILEDDSQAYKGGDDIFAKDVTNTNYVNSAKSIEGAFTIEPNEDGAMIYFDGSGLACEKDPIRVKVRAEYQYIQNRLFLNRLDIPVTDCAQPR